VREADDPSLEALPPLRTRLPGSGSRGVPVKLRARLSEVGTLDLVAAKVGSSDEYRLEFDLRAQDEPVGESDDQPAFRELDPGRVDRAAGMLSECFGPESPPGSKNLVTRMERILKSKRDQWPLPIIRGFFEILRPDQAHRKGPLELEATWFNLTGFCLRPGYGYPGDAERLELMLPVLEAGCSSWDHRARAEWWVLWRRVAGGLDRQVQTGLFESLLPEIKPVENRREAGPASAQEWMQIWMLAASLERVSVSAKRDLGETILRGLETGREPPQTLWCLGRLGARALVHGGIETVVSTDRVERWIEQLLALPEKKRDHYPLALTLLARMTDDRSRDIDRELRRKVLERLDREKAQASWLRMVREVVVDEPIDRRMLGEALPPGLRLLA